MKRRPAWALALTLACLLFGLIGWIYSHARLVVDGQRLGSNKVETVVAGMASVFVLEASPTEVVLVDAGMAPEAPEILEALKRRSLGPQAVTAVLLTHGHQDHIGGLPAFPRAQVYGLLADAELVEGHRTSDSPFGRLIKARPTGSQITHPIEDGDRLTLGTIEVEVFALPGHTPGSAAFLAEGVLFLGDSAAGLPDGTLHGASWLFSEDLDQNKESLRALATQLGPRADEVEVIAFSHQGPLNGLSPLLDWAAH